MARPKDAGDDSSVAADRADLIIAKQRAGAVGDIKLNFIREITRFEDIGYTPHYNTESLGNAGKRIYNATSDVMDVENKTIKEDTLVDVKFSGISWYHVMKSRT